MTKLAPEIKKTLKDFIQESLALASQSEGACWPYLPIEVEVPKNPLHGHYSTNIAMKLAPLLRRPPALVAKLLTEKMALKTKDYQPYSTLIKEVRIEGQGFLNFSLKDEVFIEALKAILERGHDYARSEMGKGKRVLVEFVSSNPTGPLTIGHGRQAVLGDVLSNILSFCGFSVTREYYYNDSGTQMDIFARSLYARYQQLYNPDFPFPENGYQGEYLSDLARKLREEVGDKFKEREEPEVLTCFRQYGLKAMMEIIDQDLKSFGIKFDTWAKESTFIQEGKVQHAFESLKEKDSLYEKDGALWFKSSSFGDEKDRVVRRGSGELTYFAPDIAYHIDKFERGYHWAINIWGADHHGYKPRLMAVMKALGYPHDFLSVIVHQMVSFIRHGQEIKMSTRQGEFITLKDLLQEIGSDAARFFFLLRSHDSHLNFDLDLAKQTSLENPVYYLQYAHARICSIKDHARKEGLDVERLHEANLALLKEKEEGELMRLLFLFPQVVEESAQSLESHRLPAYLLPLCDLFHSYYNKHRVVSPDNALSTARLALVEAIRIVLNTGLTLMGIRAPEKM